MSRPSDECLTKLRELGYRVERSPVNLVTYRVFTIADDKQPSTLVGEWSEREIWERIAKWEGTPNKSEEP